MISIHYLTSFGKIIKNYFGSKSGIKTESINIKFKEKFQKWGVEFQNTYE